MFFQVGSVLRINDIQGTVIGYIKYANPEDGNKIWTEYRLRTDLGERWLSVDEIYDEYSISWPSNEIQGQIGPEWHKVDEGTQVVQEYGGDVDVDPGERSNFVEYEDESQNNTLSVEIWSEGAEYSRGFYVEKTDIEHVGYNYVQTRTTTSNNININASSSLPKVIGIIVCVLIVFTILSTIGSKGSSSSISISKYLSSGGLFNYVTSITGNEQQEATVYTYYINSTTDDVAKTIIDGIKGDTESVTQKDDKTDEEIAILTDKEYCLIYHPEDNANEVYVQVSDRKYNYTSDNAPYKSSSKDTSWYRSHYFSSAYSSDSSTYKSSPSAYTMYSGSTVHNIGNGYFDSYSNSVRQSSVSTRNSSSGGISSGK